MNVASSVTWLFVPGDRSDRFEKAAASGADEVIVDLQDAVASSAKSIARRAVLAWLQSGGEACVRINPVHTREGMADVAALADWQARIDDWENASSSLRAVMLPLTEDVADVAHLAAALPGVQIIVLVESARGISRLRDLCEHPATSRAAFGNLDMAVDIGADQDSVAIASARSAVIIESRAARLPAPIDGVTPDFSSPSDTLRDARSSRRDGFGGKLCIHPTQLAWVDEAFAPSEQDVVWARLVVEAAATPGHDALQIGAVSLDGQMLDAPVIKRAQSILAHVPSHTEEHSR